MSPVDMEKWCIDNLHSLQGQTVTYTDKYGLLAGGAAAAAALVQKQMQYGQSHGIG